MSSATAALELKRIEEYLKTNADIEEIEDEIGGK